MKNRAAGNILQRRDNKLDDDLTQYADHHSFFVIEAFQQLWNRGDAQLTVLFCDQQTHADGADSPGRGVPTGGQSDFICLLGDADRGCAADGQSDDGDGDQCSRQFSSGEHIIFDAPAGPFFCPEADQKQDDNVG